MESLKVKDLREIAKSKGLKGWYRLRKSDLISFIKEFENQRRQERLEKSHGATSTKTRGSKARGGTTSRGKTSRGRKISPDSDQILKRPNPKVSEDNDWRNRRSKPRHNV